MPYKLVCFDVDGTLIDNCTFSWQLFHDYFKTDKTRREAAKQEFLSGNITYEEWAQHDAQLWKEKKATKNEFLKALDSVSLMPGAMETLTALKKKGFKLAIISGSLDILLEKHIPDYETFFDDIFISHLFFDKNGVVERIQATKFDMEKKAEALKIIAKRENIRLEECVFVGDYLNDIKIMQEAGLGIAFNCRHDELKKVANVVVEGKDLKAILPHIL